MSHVRSVNLTPWSSTRKVYEVLEPGCISRELLQKSDVVLNLNHNSDVVNVLGRYRNNPDKDTLSLELRGDGIDCRCDLPKTNNANDTLELIRRGDINGMSFAFEDDWEDSEKRITGLYDVSIVTHPAYEQTTVGTREASDAIEKAIEDMMQRECGDDEAKKKAEEEAKAEEERKAQEAKEQAEREAKEREERELEEQAQRARESQMLRLRSRRLRSEIDF